MARDQPEDGDGKPPGSRFGVEWMTKTRDPSVAKRKEKLEEELS